MNTSHAQIPWLLSILQGFSLASTQSPDTTLHMIEKTPLTQLALPVIREMPAGRVVLAASSTGTCVSVVWPETSRFAVYSQRTGEVWERVDEGSGTAVVWALASPTYAVLHQAQARILTPECERP